MGSGEILDQYTDKHNQGKIKVKLRAEKTWH